MLLFRVYFSRAGSDSFAAAFASVDSDSGMGMSSSASSGMRLVPSSAIFRSHFQVSVERVVLGHVDIAYESALCSPPLCSMPTLKDG